MKNLRDQFMNIINIVTSYNRCISDFTIASSKFFALLVTSDIPQNLDETLNGYEYEW